MWWGPFFKSVLHLLQYCFCFMFWFFGCKTCGILASQPGIECAHPALEGEVLTPGPPGRFLSQLVLGPSEQESVKETWKQGSPFFKVHQDAALRQGHLAAWRSALSREAALCGLAGWAMQMSRSGMSSCPHFLYPAPTPLCDQSGPKYIIKYTLLIKTVVEAHKGKLLICAPACHFCLCE